MFGLFKSAPFSDPQLGELRRTRGLWRGAVVLGEAQVPLALSGSRTAPDPQALDIARSIPSSYATWRPSIERAMFEHYTPYAEAVAAGDGEPPQDGLPHIDGPSGVWRHTDVEFVQITPLSGELTMEIGYRVAWDEEHTLGARFLEGRLLELCGSVPAP
jgi:hypothetical protein